MDVGAEILLVGGVGWLEEEDGLGEEEEGGDVEEGVGGEEDDGVDEYGGPDCGCELWEVSLWRGGGKEGFWGDERSRYLLGRLWRFLGGARLVVVLYGVEVWGG